MSLRAIVTVSAAKTPSPRLRRHSAGPAGGCLPDPDPGPGSRVPADFPTPGPGRPGPAGQLRSRPARLVVDAAARSPIGLRGGRACEGPAPPNLLVIFHLYNDYIYIMIIMAEPGPAPPGLPRISPGPYAQLRRCGGLPWAGDRLGLGPFPDQPGLYAQQRPAAAHQFFLVIQTNCKHF